MLLTAYVTFCADVPLRMQEKHATEATDAPADARKDRSILALRRAPSRPFYGWLI